MVARTFGGPLEHSGPARAFEVLGHSGARSSIRDPRTFGSPLGHSGLEHSGREEEIIHVTASYFPQVGTFFFIFIHDNSFFSIP